MKNSKNKRNNKYIVIAVAVLVLSVMMVYMVQAGTFDASNDQPVVAGVDYVDAKVNELTAKINDLTAKITDLTSKNADLSATVDKLNQQMQQGGTGTGGGAFQAINVKAGKKVIGGASTEMVVRSGQAKAIGIPGAGISDLTGGKDLMTDYTVPTNHLILIPRDDGRGVRAVTDIWIMVKGTYTIK